MAGLYVSLNRAGRGRRGRVGRGRRGRVGRGRSDLQARGVGGATLEV